MSQHDYNIANGGGAAVRADINAALTAIQSLNSGATAPAATKPYMPWFDTTAGVMKFRNALDTDWVTGPQVDAAGKVGIGTILPLTALNVNGSGGELLRISVTPDGGVQQEPALGFATGVTNTHPAVKISALEFDASDSRASLLFYTRGDNADSAPTERARIDSSGNFLVGTTSQIATVSRFTLGVPNNTQWGISMKPTDSDGSYRAVSFANFGSTNIGAISCTTSATSYVTSSDYRLKEDIAPMTGALDKVALLKPITYKWKATGESTNGFIAHELAEIVPECVVGEKDAVDAEGNPQYQGIDTSFLVATLTAAIQEQQTLITALTARIDILEQGGV